MPGTDHFALFVLRIRIIIMPDASYEVALEMAKLETLEAGSNWKGETLSNVFPKHV